MMKWSLKWSEAPITSCCIIAMAFFVLLLRVRSRSSCKFNIRFCFKTKTPNFNFEGSSSSFFSYYQNHHNIDQCVLDVSHVWFGRLKFDMAIIVCFPPFTQLKTWVVGTKCWIYNSWKSYHNWIHIPSWISQGFWSHEDPLHHSQ